MPRATSSAKNGSHGTAGSGGRRSGTRSSSRRSTTSSARTQPANPPAGEDAGRGVGDGITNLAEVLANRLIKPFDLVLLTRDRIQATLDDAAERGRVTRTDANELVAELVRRGRQQTDDVLGELDGVLGRSRDQLETTTRRARRAEPVDRIVRGADRARRAVGVGTNFPISGYDELTVGQVSQRLAGLSPPELRQVSDYERKHANRKSVLGKIEKLLA